MGIGTYRHLVTLEHPVVELDPPTWACSLQPAAQVSEGLAAFFVRGRFHPGIGLETQFVFEGRTFQVQSVQDLDERHREIQVTAVEVVGRGTTPGGAPVFVPPTITVGPVGATIDSGESVILTVIAVGAVPLFYQWTKDGADLPGAVYQFLDTGPVTVTTAYAVRVSNAYGSVLSAPAIVTVTATYQSQVIADGASAYWPLDDPSGTTAEDLVAGNHGTISGGVTLNQPGVTADSKAMVFDGTTGGITVPAVTVPVLGTIEFWCRFADAGSLKGPLGSLGTGDVIVVYINTTAFLVYGGAGFSQSAAGTLGTITANAWHHCVVAFDGATMWLYVDGALDTSPSFVSTTPGTGTFHIGEINTLWFAGSMQDVAIYPRALTPAEIAAHYALRVPA
jgi:Concanavalin A-like lectin/glucanases superfamily